MRIVLFAWLFAVLSFSAFSGSVADCFSDCLPQSAETVFFFDLQKLRTVPFLNTVTPTGLPMGPEKRMSALGFDPTPDKAVLFFSGERCGLLLSSALSAESKDRILREKLLEPGIVLTKTSAPEHMTLYHLQGTEMNLLPSDPDHISCVFLRKNISMFSTEDSLRHFLSEKRGVRPTTHSALRSLPENAAITGVLYPDNLHNNTTHPVWINAARIAFAFSWQPKESFPLSGTVLLFPKNETSSDRLMKDTQKLINDAYAAGRKQGEIRPEMLCAFRVLPGPDSSTMIKINLTEPDAKDFFTLLSAEWKGMH